MTKDKHVASDVDRLKQFCADFNLRVPTYEAALELLCQKLELAYGTQCTGCGSSRTERNGRIRKCNDCRLRRSVTAGTFFHNSRKIRELVCMIESIDEGIVCNKADYHRATGMARSSASVVIDKITMMTHDDVVKAGYTLEESSTFLPLYGKRSSETPAREPPHAEQLACQRERESLTPPITEPEKLSSPAEITPGIDAFELMPQAKGIFELLAKAPLSTEDLIVACDLSVSDVLSGLAILEIAGLVCTDPQGRLTLRAANGFSSDANSNAAPTNNPESALAAIDYIRRCFHAVSRKYVQLYLISHWWRQQNHLWKQGLIFSACAAAKYIRGRDLLKYVSPMRLKVAT
jgi:hypothetical protein